MYVCPDVYVCMWVYVYVCCVSVRVWVHVILYVVMFRDVGMCMWVWMCVCGVWMVVYVSVNVSVWIAYVDVRRFLCVTFLCMYMNVQVRVCDCVGLCVDVRRCVVRVGMH